MGRSIGLFGGTFDPIHFGHLNLAIELKEKGSLDEVWFCPAWINPHKVRAGVHPAPAKHRLEMLRLAIQEIPGFKILDWELKREGLSYTLDTLKEVHKQEQDPSVKFFLLLGDDAIPGFFHWHKPDEIIKLATLLIGVRSGDFDVNEIKGDPKICDSIIQGLVPTRKMEISATEIRQRIKEDRYCGHLVPKEILDYIYKNQLYLS
jgi:nicotinate-nucleotide adenylyltransferase